MATTHIPPDVFRLAARGHALHTSIKAVQSTPSGGLEVCGNWRSADDLFGTSKASNYIARIPANPRAIYIDNTQYATSIAQDLADVLKTVSSGPSVEIWPRALHVTASSPRVSALVGVTKDGMGVHFHTHYSPGSRLYDRWNAFHITVSKDKLLQGAENVPIIRVWGDYGNEIEKRELYRSDLKVYNHPDFGVVLRYTLGTTQYGFTLAPSEWRALMWLLLNWSKQDPECIELPEPRTYPQIALQDGSMKLVLQLVAPKVLIRTYPVDGSVFPLCLVADMWDFRYLRRNRRLLHRDATTEESVDVEVRDYVGNKVDHPNTKLTLRRVKGEQTISIGFAGVHSNWPRSHDSVSVTPLQLLKALKRLLGEQYQRRHELCRMLEMEDEEFWLSAFDY